jgi:hypothetical protein
LVASRSIALVPKEGRGCRFVTISPRRLTPVMALLQRHGVEIERVTTTVGKAFTV